MSKTARFGRRGRAFAGALAVLALLAGFAAWRSHTTRVAAIAAAHAAPLRFAWRAGTEYVYAFDFATTQKSEGPTGSKPIEAELRLKGELAVRCYEARGTSFVLGVAPLRLDEARLAVAGGDDAKTASELAGQEVMVAVDDHGRITEMRQRRALSEATKTTLGALVASLAVTFADDAAQLWEADEPAPLGNAHARYQRDPDSDAVTRQRVRYVTLLGAPSDASKAQVNDMTTFAIADGALASLADVEETSVPAVFSASVRTSANLVRTAAFVPTPIASSELEARAPNQVGSVEGARKSSLEQLAGGMTLARIESTIGALAAGAKLPTGFVTQAVAFLKLHPDQAQGMVDMFERPELGANGRALVCDLLASAGHPEAQQAMRDALSTDIARRDPKEFGGLLQRFSLVATPTRESLDFVYRQYDKPLRADVRGAAALALGSTMGNTARGGDRSELAAMNDRLRGDLAKAHTPEDKGALLGAFGNAGLRDNVELVRTFGKDKSPEVRAQAAYALRKTDDDEVHATLLDLVADADPGVTLAALDVLAQQSLDHATLARIADYAKTSSYEAEVAEGLVSFVARKHDDLDAATQTLEQVAAHAGDPRTRMRAQIVLDQITRRSGT